MICTCDSNNASDDPDYGLNFTKYGLDGGLPLLGYAAANSSGLIHLQQKMKNNETLNRYDISNITQLYINTLIDNLVSLLDSNMSNLIKSNKVGNHVGGQYYPYDETVPFTAGFTEHNTLPGWSFYDTIPQNIKQIEEQMVEYNKTKWMAAEWWLDGGNNTQLWFENMNNTLSFMDCHSLAIYNWDNSFENNIYAIKAIQQLVQTFG